MRYIFIILAAVIVAVFAQTTSTLHTPFIVPEGINAGASSFTSGFTNATGNIEITDDEGSSAFKVGPQSPPTGYNPAFIATRYMYPGTASVANAHGFSDKSAFGWNQRSDHSYNSYDAYITFGGGTVTMNHYAAYQYRPSIYAKSVQNIYAFCGLASTIASTCTNIVNMYGWYYVQPTIIDPATFTNNVQYGAYIGQLSTAQTNWAFYADGNTRSYFGGGMQGGSTSVLTDATATSLLWIAVANTNAVSGDLSYEIFATDGTDTQVIKGRTQFGAAAKSTTVSCNVSDVQITPLCTSGTLTATIAANVLTNNVMAITINADTSLTTTNVVARWRIETPSTFIVNAL